MQSITAKSRTVFHYTNGAQHSVRADVFVQKSRSDLNKVKENKMAGMHVIFWCYPLLFSFWCLVWKKVIVALLKNMFKLYNLCLRNLSTPEKKHHPEIRQFGIFAGQCEDSQKTSCEALLTIESRECS